MGINTISHSITLLSRLFDTQKVRHGIIPDISGKPACRVTPIRQPLPRVRPEEVGLDSRKIEAFLKEIDRDETLNMHSVMILRYGKIVAEAEFGEQDMRIWKQTFSACKSITSLAIGILCDEGKLSLDEKLTDIFDKRIPPLARLALKELSVRHLLTMTSGASFNEIASMTERDWIKGYFSGTFSLGDFSYNSLNSYILSAVVREKSGMSLSDLLRQKLFAPMGIDEFFWECCPMGIEKGGWGLYLRPEDMAKLGLLVMQNGVWNGKSLLSRSYIEEAARAHVSSGTISPLYDYGYHIWVGRENSTFLFNGLLGQNVLAFRDSGILLVTNAGNSEIFHSGNYFPLAEKYFGKTPTQKLPPSDANYADLQGTLHALKEHLPAPKLHPLRRLFKKRSSPVPFAQLPPECAQLNGVRFESTDPNAPAASAIPLVLQAVQNNYRSGFHALSFYANGNRFYMTYAEEDESYLLPIGFDTSADADIKVGGVPYRVKTRGAFVRDEDDRPLLKIRITFCETPLTRYIKLYYTGNAPYLKMHELPGGDFIYFAILTMKNALVLAPIIGGTVDKIDNDYLRYRVNKVFAPRLRLTKTVPAAPQKSDDGMRTGKTV